MRRLIGLEEGRIQHWMEEAAECARNSLCLNARCGAIIVSTSGMVIGSGFNAPPQDDISKRKCRETFSIPAGNKHDLTCCVHAEERACNDALRYYSHKLEDSVLYFTRTDNHNVIIPSDDPYCTLCSRRIADLGIGHVVLFQEE